MSGELLLGRYELGERLGAGGMASVRRAFDRRLERNVALKLLAEHLADDPQFVQRFEREAKSAARLVHPNIVQVFDYGFEPEHGRHYIVMELVEGKSGAQLLQQQGRLPLETVLHLADGACRGLEHAHRGGVIHRDVKPGNLLLASDGQVKLADFGIAWAGDSLAVTQHGAVLGTVAYLAPEQATGGKATPAADVYGLGVVIFQLLTGRLPFQGQSLSELVLAQRDRRPPMLDRLLPGVPPHVADAVDRAISYDAGRRPASADQFRQLLLGAATGVTRLGDEAPTSFASSADPTGATRVVSRRQALTGRSAAAAAPAQRLQPHAPQDDRPAPARRAPARPEPVAGKGASPVTTLVVALILGLLMAGAGFAAGGWLSDRVQSRAEQRLTGSDSELQQLLDQAGQQVP